MVAVGVVAKFSSKMRRRSTNITASNMFLLVLEVVVNNDDTVYQPISQSTSQQEPHPTLPPMLIILTNSLSSWRAPVVGGDVDPLAVQPPLPPHRLRRFLKDGTAPLKDLVVNKG